MHPFYSFTSSIRASSTLKPLFIYRKTPFIIFCYNRDCHFKDKGLVI